MHFAGITIGNIQNVMGVLYSATNFQGMFNLMNVLPVVGYERSVFYRCTLRSSCPDALCPPGQVTRVAVAYANIPLLIWQSSTLAGQLHSPVKLHVLVQTHPSKLHAEMHGACLDLGSCG